MKELCVFCIQSDVPEKKAGNMVMRIRCTCSSQNTLLKRRKKMNQAVIAGVIFLAAIIAIMTEKINRTTASILGMVLLLAFKVLSLDQAVSYIDFNTLGVLIGMMLFVGVIKHSGLFEYISIKAAKKSRRRSMENHGDVRGADCGLLGFSGQRHHRPADGTDDYDDCQAAGTRSCADTDGADLCV